MRNVLVTSWMLIWLLPAHGDKVAGERLFRATKSVPPKGGWISVIDADHIWVGLVHTANGGKSWTAVSPEPADSSQFDNSGPEFQITSFFSDRSGILGSYDAIWSTHDGGRSWSRILYGHLSGVWSGRGESGWLAAGDDQSVGYYVTRDAGRTWRRCGGALRADGAPLGSAFFVDSTHGWTTFARFNEKALPIVQGVASTDDAGCHWHAIWWNQKGLEEPLREVTFADAHAGWLLPAAPAAILSTVDGGLSWSPVSLPAKGFLPESGFLVDRLRGWLAGSSIESEAASGIYYTKDGGRVWIAISQRDLEDNQGLAPEIPLSWGYGYLMKTTASNKPL